jgi:hypothetical protein
MYQIIEGLLAVAALLTYSISVHSSKSKGKQKALNRIACLETLTLLVMIAITETLLIFIAMIPVTITLAYAINSKNLDISTKFIGLLAISVIFATYAAHDYKANIKDSGESTVLSESRIEMLCVREKISSTKADGKYGFIQVYEDGGISFEFIPEIKTTEVNIFDIRESYIKEIVEEHKALNYNYSPPSFVSTWQETRYELYAPDWSIYKKE